MSQTRRFGKRIPLPSTVQVVHELLAFSAAAEARKQSVETAAALPDALAEPDMRSPGVAPPAQK